MAIDQSLFGRYTVKQLNQEQFLPIFRKHRRDVFPKGLEIDANATLDQAEIRAYQRLIANMGTPYRLHLGVYYDEKCVGWTTGWQRDGRSYYMSNTGILPDHQGNGIYSALLPIIIKTVTAQGFQTIYSRHHPQNSAVLIPKLKAGFIITNFELALQFGMLVHLTYYANPTQRKAMAFRSGEILHDAVRPYLDL